MKFTKKKKSNKQNKTKKTKKHTHPIFFFFLQKLITINIQLKGEL